MRDAIQKGVDPMLGNHIFAALVVGIAVQDVVSRTSPDSGAGRVTNLAEPSIGSASNLRSDWTIMMTVSSSDEIKREPCRRTIRHVPN
jgi:hypothetical protein